MKEQREIENVSPYERGESEREANREKEIEVGVFSCFHNDLEV